MKSVQSKDGTTIAYDRSGKGPALILIDGALRHRGFGPTPAMAKLLAAHFTVFNYDRRGRGESTHTAPYSVEREIEDIEAPMPALTAVGGKSPDCGHERACECSSERAPFDAAGPEPYGQGVGARAGSRGFLCKLERTCGTHGSNFQGELTLPNKEKMFMSITTESASVSKASLWTGRITSALVVLFMLFDSITKILKFSQVIEASAKVGVNANEVFWIGVTLLVCVILYVIPRTSILGAILLAGYLGGAVCTNVLAHQPVFNICFAVGFGVLVWLGLYLREPRLRALVPLKS